MAADRTTSACEPARPRRTGAGRAAGRARAGSAIGATAAVAVAVGVGVALAVVGSPAAAEPLFTRVAGLPGTDGPLDAEWHLPGDGAAGAPPPASLVLLQHGFTRRCAHLRTLAAALAEAGHATVCLNADVARGNPALAEAWARRLVGTAPADVDRDGRPDTATGPDGRPLPARIVVAGHSAGAQVAAVAGEVIAREVPARLVGALLLDPVAASPRFATALAAVSAEGRRPVRAVLAEPDGCNAHGNARPALLAVQAAARAAGRDANVGVQVIGGTHIDAEGPDTDTLAVWVCGPRRPAAAATVRSLVVRWVGEMTGVPDPVAGRGDDGLAPTRPIEP